KAQAERLAKQYRENLNIHPCAPLCAFKLAEHLKVPVSQATKFLVLQNEINWLSNDCEWSALTMPNFEGTKIIIHNPFHSYARQQSDLMHELAHIICNHQRKETDNNFSVPFGMRYYDEEQEEEAKCLGATLQLATPCLLWARKRNMTIEAIGSHFNASKEMVKYRMNMIGIAKRRR
ncbi:MAG TPA: ImmA/IrrE family metallo-endopeptidase, partial [Hanamia sp.]|nr:ImmA/IrrE family metallo-endopeptidase [Hanamia sp.]